MLSVEPMLDQGAFFVKLVQDEVSVGLMSCCEDHYLVKFGHVCQESDAEWTHFVHHASMIKMD